MGGAQTGPVLNNGTASVVISCDVPSHTLPSLCEGALLFGKDKVGGWGRAVLRGFDRPLK